LCNRFGFREESQLSVNERFLTQKYQGYDDGFEIIVKSTNVSVCIDIAHVEPKMENLMNLRHPCISCTMGVILRSPLRNLEIVRVFSAGRSLSEVISASPEWWTPTAKAKTIAGIVLSLRFAHSFGLLHGHLTGDNLLFEHDGLIQVCDFCQNSLSEIGGNSDRMAEIGGFAGENWRPAADVRAFTTLLSRIMIGNSAVELGCSRSVPAFVLKMSINDSFALESKDYPLSMVSITNPGTDRLLLLSSAESPITSLERSSENALTPAAGLQFFPEKPPTSAIACELPPTSAKLFTQKSQI
jgi:serine/threonine protein kinase